MRLSFPVLFFLAYCVYHCVIFPIIASIAARKRHGEQPPIPRTKIYLRIVLRGILFAGTAILVGWLNQIPILGSSHIGLKPFLLASGFLALTLGLDSLEWKYMSVARKGRLSRLTPHTVSERMLWAPVSLITGIGEEFVFRAVLFGILYQMIGDYWSAAVISAVLFTFMHLGMGGWLSLVSLFFVALGLQWLVQVSGGLYLAIAVHFFHNLINGIVYGAMSETTSDLLPADRQNKASFSNTGILP